MNSDTDHSATTLKIRSRTELLGNIRNFVSDAALDFGFTEIEVGKIELAIDEACTNIIKHAYKYDPEGTIEIKLSTRKKDGEPAKFIVDIFDNGLSFNAERYTAPDMKEYFKKLRHGGLGIVLIKKLMDEVEYNFEPGTKNSIRLIKHLAT